MTDSRRIDLCAACRKRCHKKSIPTPCEGCRHAVPPLLAANRQILQLMTACRTQWRVGFSGPFGLDYVAVSEVARLRGFELDATAFAGLQALENEQLAIWAEQRPKKDD